MLRLSFLNEADRGIDDHHGQNHDRVDQMPQQRCNGPSRQQDVDEKIVELTQEADQRTLALRFGQPVRPVETTPPVGLVVGQTVRDRLETLHGLRGGPVVPGDVGVNAAGCVGCRHVFSASDLDRKSLRRRSTLAFVDVEQGMAR